MSLAILHITTFLQGGAGRVLCDLARHQRDEGHRVFVVTDDSPVPGYKSYPEYLTALSDAGIPALPVHATFRRDMSANLRAAARVRELILDEMIDIVHAHAAVPALIVLLARSGLQRRLPIVLSMQGWGTNKTPEQEASDIATMNLLDAVLPVSEAAARFLQGKGVIPGLIDVIPNAIDGRCASGLENDLTATLRSWRSAGLRSIGCVGSLCERKDQATLIRALALMGRPDLRLVLIGEGDEATLRELAEALGVAKQVLFAGYRTNADAYLSRFDVLVLPSRSEGLPLTVLEAFREGVPVVASDIPEIAEIVREGETGRLFRAGEPADLGFVLNTVLEEAPSEREKRVREARRLFGDNYLMEVMCGRYMNQYRRMLTGP